MKIWKKGLTIATLSCIILPITTNVALAQVVPQPGADIGGIIAGGTDMLEPINAMTDVFNNTFDPSTLTGVTGDIDSEENKKVIDSAVGVASELDVKSYSEAMESALVTAGIDDEVANKTAKASTSMTSAILNSANSGELITAVSGVPTCTVALGGIAAAGAELTAGGVAAVGTAGASLVVAGGTAAATATATLPGMLGCARTTGAIVGIAGNIVSAYENDPDAPQMLDIVGMMNPNTGVGKRVIDNLPVEAQQPAIEAMTLTSAVATPLAKLKFGDTLNAYAKTFQDMGSGNLLAAMNLLPISLQLGMKVTYAIIEAVGLIAPTTIGALSNILSIDGEAVADGEDVSKPKDSSPSLSPSAVNKVTEAISESDDLDEDVSVKNDSKSNSTSNSNKKDSLSIEIDDDYDESLDARKSSNSTKSSSPKNDNGEKEEVGSVPLQRDKAKIGESVLN